MKRKVVLVLVFLLLPCLAWGGELDKSLKQAVGELGLRRGSESLCVLTNAPYVAHTCLDVIQKRSGCSVARGNLLFYHCPMDRPLKLALFNRDSRKLVVLSAQPDGRFTSVSLTVGPQQTADPAAWLGITKALDADLHMVATLNAWADGAPYDLLKCIELHNHFCPGVTSGYLMGRYIMERWPLEQGQAYLYIAAPVWCKEDAIQQLLDLTAGKKGIITRQIDKQAQKDLPFDQPAGILVVRQGRNGGGVAHVMTFDWKLAWQGVDRKSGGMRPNPLSWNDDPQKYIKVPLSVKLSAEQVDALAAAANPYEVLNDLRKVK